MTDFIPEAQLILATLRAFIQGESLPDLFPVHWEQVFVLAAQQRLIPILHTTLTKTSMPPEVWSRLDQAARQQRIRTAMLVDAFVTINEAMAQAGIAVMPVKGMYLAHRVYQSVNHRYFDDIDLLIPAEATREAVAVMHRLGYITHPQAEKPDWHHLAPFLHQQSKVVVELHTDLIRRAGPGWGVAEIWQRANRGRIAGIETTLISEVDALIHTALHARHNRYKRLSFFLDAHLQLSHLQAPQQRELLLMLAREAGAQVALAYLGQVGHRLWNAAAWPVSVTGWRGRMTERLAQWHTFDQPLRSTGEGPLPNVLELLLMDRWSDSLRLAYRLLFPPPQFLADYYGGDKPFNYGKRFFLRTRRITRQLWGRDR
ncbi:MAG: nucleotidyltransferase family protein [Chloroflexi bacterium]|nr:nucleotidyltransferase family protein [Chloroflexota bacterium]MBP8054782.1 nucleotidyltransferase family protein [Chloroflexota bacterium]